MLNRPHEARGMALLESLASLAILAVGLLGLLSAQVRSLADTQTGVRRAQAVRLIEDLAERMHSNREGFRESASIVGDWEAGAASTSDCEAAPCNPSELAAWDLAAWKKRVAQSLPLGRAAIVQAGATATDATAMPWGIVVAWRANEHDDGADFLRHFRLDPASTGGIECPPRLTCHLSHVRP